MAWGLPIVATATGETQALIDHERQGWLVPPGAAGALADGILRLVQNPELAAALGGEARLQATHEFNLERVVEQHLLLFQQTLDPSRNA